MKPQLTFHGSRGWSQTGARLGAIALPRGEVLVTGIVYLVAVLPALFGLPLRAGAPIHHYVLTWPVVVAVVVANVRCARRVALRPRTVQPWILPFISVPVAFFLYVGAFDALIADQDRGLAFVAALVGVGSESVRSTLVFLMGLFVLVATLTLTPAFAGKEHAASIGLSTTADEADTDASTTRPTFRDAAEPAAVKSNGSRKTPANGQANGVNTLPNQSSPASPRGRSLSNFAAPADKPAESSPSPAEHDPVPPMVDAIGPGTAGATQPVLPAWRMPKRKIVWAALSLVLVGVFLALTWVWNAQAVTGGTCKCTVQRSAQIANAHKLLPSMVARCNSNPVPG